MGIRGIAWIGLASAILTSVSAVAGTPFRLDCDGTSFEVPMVVSSSDGIHAKVSASFDVIDDIAVVDYQNLVVRSGNGVFGVDLPRTPNLNGSFSLRLNQNLQGSVEMTSTDGDALPYSGRISCRRTR